MAFEGKQEPPNRNKEPGVMREKFEQVRMEHEKEV
jgi:hypothetical protein